MLQRLLSSLFGRPGTLSTRISHSVLITVPIVVAVLWKQRNAFDHHECVSLLIVTLSTPSSKRWTVDEYMSKCLQPCFMFLLTNNATIKDVDGQLKNDKSSEHKSSGVLPEEVTLFFGRYQHISLG